MKSRKIGTLEDLLATARATHVEPVSAAGRWSLALVVVLLAFVAFILFEGAREKWDSNVMIAAIVVVGLIGAPLALGLNKLLTFFKEK